MNIAQAYEKFPTRDDCLACIEKVWWVGKPTCPYCRSKKFTSIRLQRKYHCNTCNCSYTVTVLTIFHKTHVDLQKWFVAIDLLLNARVNRMPISSRQLAKELEINRNTAWLMMKKIDRAMSHEQDRNLLLKLLEL